MFLGFSGIISPSNGSHIGLWHNYAWGLFQSHRQPVLQMSYMTGKRPQFAICCDPFGEIYLTSSQTIKHKTKNMPLSHKLSFRGSHQCWHSPKVTQGCCPTWDNSTIERGHGRMCTVFLLYEIAKMTSTIIRFSCG